MKRVIRSNNFLTSNDDSYTDFISEDLPAAVNVFMNTFDDELDYATVKDACEAFWNEYKQFPNSNSMDSLDIKYDDDKGRFYRKYVEFARRCRNLAKSRRFNPSGYGKKDYSVLKMRDRMHKVDYFFPYGWKQMVRG